MPIFHYPYIVEDHLVNVTMESYHGELIHFVFNNDTSSPATPAGTGTLGAYITLTEMDVTGDIYVPLVLANTPDPCYNHGIDHPTLADLIPVDYHCCRPYR